MKKTRLFLVMALLFSAGIEFMNAQGTCSSPKTYTSIVNNAWQGVDSFTVDSFFIKIPTSHPFYSFKVHIKNLSSNPNYTVGVFNDSCSHLSSNEVTNIVGVYGDTLFIPADLIISGNNYLIKIKNNNVGTPKTVYNLYIAGRDTITSTLGGVCSPSLPPCDYICNGNFETLLATITGFGQINYILNWASGNSAGSPDAFSATSAAWQYSVDCNTWGQEFPHSGNNYVGLGAESTPFFNEYIQTQLASTLTAGQLYQGSFWVNKPEAGGANVVSL
ncbi:MAG: hypothetical protein ACXVP0_17070, partial [Bacteroidia bacterium]